MRRMPQFFSSLLMVGALIAGLASYHEAQAGAPQASARATAKVAIQNFAFSPSALTVAPGTTVTWTNQDSASHTVTSDASAWSDSGMLATGKSFSFTFTKAGTYAYHCAVHPSMTAKVVVSAAPGGTSAAAGPAEVKLATSHILVTTKGMTLYVFAADAPNKSNCYKVCAKYWPPLLAAKGMMPAATMAGVAGTFGVAARTDGTKQITYNRAPLYTFLQDKGPGDVYGQGLIASGGYWWAVVAGTK